MWSFVIIFANRLRHDGRTEKKGLSVLCGYERCRRLFSLFLSDAVKCSLSFLIGSAESPSLILTEEPIEPKKQNPYAGLRHQQCPAHRCSRRLLRELAGEEFEMAFDQREVGSSLIGLAQCECVHLACGSYPATS